MMATLRGTMNQQNRQTLGRETTVILDSGSNDTIMSQELYEALPAQTRPTLQPSSAQFFTATTGDDPHANILGTATFHITLTTTDNDTITTPVDAYIVDDLNEPILLGESWFRAHCAVRTHDHLYIPKDETRQVTLANAETTCHKVKLGQHQPIHRRATSPKNPRTPPKRPDSPSCQPLPIIPPQNTNNTIQPHDPTKIVAQHIQVASTMQRPSPHRTRRRRKRRKKTYMEPPQTRKKPPDKHAKTTKYHQPQHLDPLTPTDNVLQTNEHTFPDYQWYPIYIKQPSSRQQQPTAT